MNQTAHLPQIPRPPADRWERYTQAAARIGVPPGVLRASIESGVANIRAAKLGKRQLLHVVAADVDTFARRIASTL
jgi:hypothetical protein